VNEEKAPASCSTEREYPEIARGEEKSLSCGLGGKRRLKLFSRRRLRKKRKKPSTLPESVGEREREGKSSLYMEKRRGMLLGFRPF